MLQWIPLSASSGAQSALVSSRPLSVARESEGVRRDYLALGSYSPTDRTRGSAVGKVAVFSILER